MIRIIGMLLVCVGAALAAALLVFMLQGNQQTAQPVQQEVSKSKADAGAADVTPSEGTDLSLAKSAGTMTDQEREVLIGEIRAQLDALMKDYENHIKDREKRETLKQQIDILVTRYNELILPVSFSEVRKQTVGS